MNHWTEEGIENLRNGDRTQAERAFRIAVQEAPRDVDGWLWLSKAVTSDAERVTVLLRVLDLDPYNSTARYTLDMLQQRLGDETLPHVNPFSMEDEIAANAAAAKTPEQPFASSEVVEEKPAQVEESASRLAIWVAVAVLVLAAIMIIIIAILPRF